MYLHRPPGNAPGLPSTDVQAVRYVAKIGDETYELEIREGIVALDGQEVDVSFVSTGARAFSMILDGYSFRVLVEPDGHLLQVSINGTTIPVELQSEHDMLMERLGKEVGSVGGMTTVRAPMPGLIRAVHVSEGASVEAGDALLVLEAMKMENELHADRPGIVRSVRAVPGATVNKDETLLEIEPVKE